MRKMQTLIPGAALCSFKERKKNGVLALNLMQGQADHVACELSRVFSLECNWRESVITDCEVEGLDAPRL